MRDLYMDRKIAYSEWFTRPYVALGFKTAAFMLGWMLYAASWLVIAPAMTTLFAYAVAYVIYLTAMMPWAWKTIDTLRDYRYEKSGERERDEIALAEHEARMEKYRNEIAMFVARDELFRKQHGI